jgi:SagB-type dehydrogenase family enzyme
MVILQERNAVMRNSTITFLVVVGILVGPTIGVEEGPKEEVMMPAEVKMAPVKPEAPKADVAKEMKLSIIKLEKPNFETGAPLMKALKHRKSDRDFSDKKLTLRQLSEVLWAADGVNRDDGKRTSPSAMARYPVDIYAVLAEGVYFYDVAKHELVPVVEGDFRSQTGGQPFVATAPLNVVFVASLDRFGGRPGREMPNETKMQWAALEVGCQSQNIYLYCASEGLATVIRGMVDKEKLGPTMKLKPEQVIICAQTVGLPK